ncbi:MAG: hypothetical protein WC349_01810 [Patescibacteria group bacterium]|jgi:hypothetical protein
MHNLFIKKIFVAFVFLLAIFLLPHFIVAADVSPDAIAVRIMPNPEHLSPLRWYQANIKTQGSPQSLQVDGYEAVRDGRTVYVNAANISGNNFYTNIYIISYNQEAENATVDVFGQILSHWKFNSNLSDASGKEKIVRDAKKLADLSEVKTLLEIYKTKFNSYPKLASGSYIAGKSVSTWPSWQATLAKSLGAALPIDPVNKMGVCAGYNTTTCWNENSKKFADPNPSDNNFELPTGSSAYVYTTNNNGASYDVCAVMESGYITTLEQGACYGSAGVKVGGSSLNNPPVIVCGTLEGSPNKEFIGYVKAYDSDAVDTIKSWAITSQSTAGWSPLQLRSSKVNNQKEIYSSKSGVPGSYSFVLEVSDSRDVRTSTICSVNIKAVCGNGIIELNETCDDKTYNGQPLHCNNTCSGITSAECGNGVKEAGETCDDGSNNDKPLKCNITCNGITPSYCGNGVKEAGEDCDRKDGTASVPADSSATKQYSCSVSCQASGGYCGDSNKNTLESCDDGSLKNGKPNQCNATCTGMTLPVCGNGVIEQGEICEPATYVSPSPANSSAAHQYSCSSANCKSNIGGYCGDGVKNGSEKCDWKNYVVPKPEDSSIDNQYGCSSACNPAGGYLGDGIKNGTEGCDPNAARPNPVGSSPTNQYGCTPDGDPTGGYLGDGTINGPEECDGTIGVATSPGDSSSTRQYACVGGDLTGGYGGDGFVQTEYGEECEPSVPITCSTTFSTPCGTVPVSGSYACDSNYQLGACNPLAPTASGNTATGCAADTRSVMTNYICCTLTKCTNDGCACCGRGYAKISSGYSNYASMDSTTWDSSVLVSGYTSYTYCGDLGSAGNEPTNACRLNRSTSNSKNWEITANHATARFTCWK